MEPINDARCTVLDGGNPSQRPSGGKRIRHRREWRDCHRCIGRGEGPGRHRHRDRLRRKLQSEGSIGKCDTRGELHRHEGAGGESGQTTLVQDCAERRQAGAAGCGRCGLRSAEEGFSGGLHHPDRQQGAGTNWWCVVAGCCLDRQPARRHHDGLIGYAWRGGPTDRNQRHLVVEQLGAAGAGRWH